MPFMPSAHTVINGGSFDVTIFLWALSPYTVFTIHLVLHGLRERERRPLFQPSETPWEAFWGGVGHLMCPKSSMFIALALMG